MIIFVYLSVIGFTASFIGFAFHAAGASIMFCERVQPEEVFARKMAVVRLWYLALLVCGATLIYLLRD